MSMDMAGVSELDTSPERTELAETALSCMCTLLVEVTHFNFSINLVSCIVARLSRKSWDKVSPLISSHSHIPERWHPLADPVIVLGTLHQHHR